MSKPTHRNSNIGLRKLFDLQLISLEGWPIRASWFHRFSWPAWHVGRCRKWLKFDNVIKFAG